MSSFDIKLFDLEFSSKIHAVKPSSSVRAAAFTMQKHDIGCVIVSNEKREILGIVTERDILMKVVNHNDMDLDKNTVEEIMTAHPTSLSEDESIMHALNTMEIGQFRHLVVLEKDGSLKGIISIKDIVKKISNIIRSKNL